MRRLLASVIFTLLPLLSFGQTVLSPTSSSGGGGGNAAASLTGNSVPANADYTGANKAGNLAGVTCSVAGTSTCAMDMNIQGGTVSASFTTAGLATSANQTNGTAVTTVSGNATVVQGTGSNLHTVIDSGTVNLGATVNVNFLTPNVAENITQFGTSNVVTGTGAGGAGIPRFTMSNDSALAANQSVNISQTNGTTAATSQTGATSISTAGTSLIVNTVNYGIVDSTTTPAYPQGQVAPVSITSDGSFTVTPKGYGGATTAVGWASSFAVAVTNQALGVTVPSGVRIILHRAQLTCQSSVSVAVTASLGFAQSTLPTTGNGLIWINQQTIASQYQGIQDGVGWPNVIGKGVSADKLLFTMTIPTGGSCSISITYSTETTS